LNTREKIRTLDAIAALEPGRPLLLVAGYFDILQVDLVRELAAARAHTGAQSLLAVVLPLAGERVPLAERAEMTAALRVVDYVLIAQTEDLDSLAASLQPIETIRLEEADRRRARQLIEHVHRRQSC
jgi:bifunctional ADP-heptose synthase (sugar kinase/adenylyltransferase)